LKPRQIVEFKKETMINANACFDGSPNPGTEQTPEAVQYF